MADNSMMSSFEGLQCIWMKSGLVDYKLCDKNFDCDNCYFHSVMRNKSAVSDESSYSYVNDLLAKIHGTQMERGITYLHGGFAVKKLFNGTYFIGLSMLIIDLLKIESFAVMENDEKKYEEGTPFLLISGSWGTKVLNAPFRFTMLDLNAKNAPFKPGARWAAMIEVNDEDLEPHIMNDSEFRNQREEIHELIITETHTEHFAGATLHDGGTKVDSLEKLLGKEAFNRILRLLF